MRVDTEDFHGMACAILLMSGKPQNWDTPKAGKVYVCGPGMMWMTLVPDGASHIVTAMYLPDNSAHEERKNYPEFVNKQFPISVWYVDVTEGYSYDPDGVIRYTDKYLDYIFTPEGDISISDRDELDGAYESGELTKEQYKSALREGKLIEKLYTRDIKATEAMFARVRAYVERQICGGCKPMFVYHGSRYKLDVIKPQKANGETDEESLEAVYASWAAEDVFPFTLSITGYPDDPDGASCFSADGGRAHIVKGIVNPDATGYIYRLPAKTFERIKGWQWASKEEVIPLDFIELRAGNHFDRVTWSDEALEKQKEYY